MEKQARVVRTINRILDAAFVSSTEAELADTCLEAVVELTGSTLGFLSELGPDGLLHGLTRSVRPGAPAVTRRLAGLPVLGLPGRVLGDGKSLFTNDPGTHPDWVDLPPGHLPVTSFLGVPLLRDGSAFGVLAVANREGGYGPAHLELLEALSPVVVQAHARKRAEDSLKASEANYRGLFEHMLDGLAHCRMEFDGEGRPVDCVYLAVNSAFSQLTGLQDVVGKRLTEVLPGIREANPEVLET